ncbi:hypothetical protein [Spirillospora albida]|uniref:hypothetical protein n=1 Tax=Spirillospora albida TaxID=58123 RepID=UPI00056CEC63|nr:hypothetical protein [Spirillospora albida]
MTPAAARAFAKAGMTPDGALVVSAAEFRRAVNVCRAHPKVAVLTAPGAGPAELGRALFPQTPRSFVVCEDLDGPDERVVHVRPAEATTRPWHDPQVVLVLDTRRAAGAPGWIEGAVPGPAGWAPPGFALAPEALAVVLARLGPRLGDLVWDVGSGDGSVGIECARFGAAVIAVERDRARCEAIRENVRLHGVRAAVSRGEIPSVLDHLPDPDAVFTGTGGPAAAAACADRALHRVVAVSAAGEAPDIAADLARRGFAAGAVRLDATPLAPSGAPSAPTVIVWGERGARRPGRPVPPTRRGVETAGELPA